MLFRSRPVELFNILPFSGNKPMLADNTVGNIVQATNIGGNETSETAISGDEINVNGKDKGGDKNNLHNKKSRKMPSDQTPWGVETVYNDSAVASTSGGSGVNVVLLDTGIDSSHPDLKNRIYACKDFTNPRKPVINGKCGDKNGHGTHVGGIIAADASNDGLGIYGIAPAASISAFEVCGNNGSCFADDVAAALKTAADSGANIVNMSLGGNFDSSLIREAVEYAASKGVLMVAASGNDGPDEGSEFAP